MREYRYEDCVIGLKESFEVTVTEDMVTAFRNMSGDCNPLHNDEEYAKKQGFPGKVVYGMLTAAFLSTLVGMFLPGKYCLIQEMDLKFTKPVYVGQILSVSGEIIERNELFHQLVLKVKVENEDKVTVLRGKMKVGVLPEEH